MAYPRVLFASVGASLALVAMAALSLLAVSAVFSFGGWSDSPSASIRQPALVFAGSTSSPSAGDALAARRHATNEPILLAAPRGATKRAEGERSAGAAPDATSSGQRPTSREPDPTTTTPGLTPPATPHAAPLPPASPSAPPETAADGVRKIGEDVSSTVQNTGTVLAQGTAPLLPPISAAVQKVFNAVAALLTQTTDAVGGALDTLLPPK